MESAGVLVSTWLAGPAGSLRVCNSTPQVPAQSATTDDEEEAVKCVGGYRGEGRDWQ